MPPGTHGLKPCYDEARSGNRRIAGHWAHRRAEIAASDRGRAAGQQRRQPIRRRHLRSRTGHITATRLAERNGDSDGRKLSLSMPLADQTVVVIVRGRSLRRGLRPLLLPGMGMRVRAVMTMTGMSVPGMAVRVSSVSVAGMSGRTTAM
jgi:hypothetical protein